MTSALAQARSAIARAVLGEQCDASSTSERRLGDIVLRPHQREALARVQRALDRRGGALLADAVGLGKTYVALALCESARDPLVVAPAALLPMWRAALQRTGLRATLLSVEQLGRSDPAPANHDLVVVDEAHHFRNSVTRRYRALCGLTRASRTLLLTATPVHNRAEDLATLLAIFLGERAHSLDDSELAEIVVRRVDGATVGKPAVRPLEWIPLADDDAELARIVALPPALPPSDGGDGGVLLVHSLVRQWASSDGAIRAALRRRLAAGEAIAAALDSGRYPSRAELGAWTFAEDALQLAFPELVATASSGSGALLPAVRAHIAALRELLASIAARPSRDVERATALRTLRARHRGEKIVAFTSYADTVDAIARCLATDSGVAALTGRGARVAGGAITRREAIERFAPVASGRRAPREAERVDLLLTTDILSEGVNLQDASVVVHLDLPWTAARLEQRVGRIARLGSPHDEVHVYALAPPASADAILRFRALLRAKLSAAARAAGMAGMILPGITDSVELTGGVPAAVEATHHLLRRWPLLPDECPGARPVVAAVRAGTRGFLAAVGTETGVALVASLGGALTDDPTVVARAVVLADGDELVVGDAEREHAIAEIGRWCDARRANAIAGLDARPAAMARRRVLLRIADITRRAPHHVRPSLAALAADARRAAVAPGGSGAERVLGELALAPLPDEAWLRAVSAFGAAQPRHASTAEQSAEVLAVVLFR